MSGGLTTSQFPVFTIYVQKLCLPSATCSRAWTFESVEGFMIAQNIKKRGRLPTRENCMALCRAEREFPCRWDKHGPPPVNWYPCQPNSETMVFKIFVFISTFTFHHTILSQFPEWPVKVYTPWLSHMIRERKSPRSPLRSSSRHH